MPLIQILAAVAAGAGEPTLRPGLDADQVSPGPWGFFFTFALAAVVVFLIWDMTRRIRRVRYRSQVDENLAADARQGGPGSTGSSGSGTSGTDHYAGGEAPAAGGTSEAGGGSGRPERGD
ncbi:hypothetical protein ACMX2H_11945 [Arthrobacter sulfonylureivorans]|uniref:hypothetical protein n=1 Tax=Arthrobacter sulfonylureivorans TaxID=2486855 RepID=UPI0039E54BA2